MITNAFSVDVEEYYHAAVFRRGAGVRPGTTLPSRVERSVDRLLGILDRHAARGTFFVLGEVAAAHPHMVRAIASAGHEIGCHSDRHDDVHRLTPAAFREDLRRARARIEDSAGARVAGYRAPNFSIGRAERSWACQILLEEGFEYDSSVHPIVHDRYGQPDAPRFPHEAWRQGAARLLEFPIGTIRWCGVNLPIGGGGYFRLLPADLIFAGIRAVNGRERQPVMFYLHPWELDPEQPRPPMAWHHRLRHYVGIEGTAAKLSSLLTEFRFAPACEVLARMSVPALALAPALVAPAQSQPARAEILQ